MDAPGSSHVEPVLAVDPRDARRLVAAVVADRGVAVYASSDGGETWTRSPRDGAATGELDPALAFDDAGGVYLVTLGEEARLWRSPDGGRRWEGPATVPAGDRPWLAFTRGAGAGADGALVLASKKPITVFGHLANDVIAVSASPDRGRSFPFPRLLLPSPERLIVNIVSDLQVLPGGEVLLVLETFGTATVRERQLRGSHMTMLLGDGGASEPRTGPEFRVYGHQWEGKSLFGLGGGHVAVDRGGGPRRGRVYMTWLDAADGWHRVKAATSADGGATWSLPVTLSDATTTTDASTTAIAVDGRGVVGVSWYDRSEDPTDRCYRLRFAASVDGGASWSPSAALDTAPTCTVPAGLDPIESEVRFKNGGDTQGLVGLPDGFHLAWIHESAGRLQLWSTDVRVDGGR